MEGIVEHFRSDRDDLRIRLQASEAALAEERAKVFTLAARVEVAERLPKTWEEDNKRLREDYRTLREDLRALREENRTFREKIDGLDAAASKVCYFSVSRL